LADYEGFVAAEKEKNNRLGILKYEEYLKADPNSNEVYLYLSSAYYHMGNLDSAVIAAKKSVALYPEYTQALYSLTQFQFEQKKYDDAIATVNKWLLARPKDADAWWLKSNCLAAKGSGQDAIESLQKAIELRPMDGRLYQTGAQIYQAMKDQLNFNQYATALGAFNGKSEKEKQAGYDALRSIYTAITGKPLPGEEEEEE
jgi:tetratricopeptide (TPR) repeat protein